MVETVMQEGLILGVIITSDYHEDGIHFLTPGHFSQQLGYMHRPEGYVIQPHILNPVPREVQYTNEVLFIKSGKVRVDFYDDDRMYLKSRILQRGDVILLAFGGHGFEMLEESEIIEVKQGPYAGEADKTRFSTVAPAQINLK